MDPPSGRLVGGEFASEKEVTENESRDEIKITKKEAGLGEGGGTVF